MSRHDKRILILGICIGFVVAAAVAAGLYFRLRQTQATPTDSAAATPAATGDTQVAAQLSPDEQAKIGLQTAEVRTEALTQEIATIGRVEEPIWVKADVFDSDLAKVRIGLTGTITSEALPGEKLSGKVDSIGPRSDPQTRTTPVRVQVDKPGTLLRPGMIVQVALRIPVASVLTVPRDAVLDNGTEKIVYVARENGIFQQQRIQTGTPVGDRYPVLDGLKGGDKVVTNGVFLVDSQTRLTGGLTGMFGGSKSYTEGTAAPAAAPGAYKMTVRLEPDPPQGAKENKVHVTLVDTAGKPVPDAQVRASFQMPAMPAMNMPEMRNGTDLKWTGSEYVGPIQIMMAGGWNVTVEARRGPELLSTTQSHINAK